MSKDFIEFHEGGAGEIWLEKESLVIEELPGQSDNFIALANDYVIPNHLTGVPPVHTEQTREFGDPPEPYAVRNVQESNPNIDFENYLRKRNYSQR